MKNSLLNNHWGFNMPNFVISYDFFPRVAINNKTKRIKQTSRTPYILLLQSILFTLHFIYRKPPISHIYTFILRSIRSRNQYLINQKNSMTAKCMTMIWAMLQAKKESESSISKPRLWKFSVYWMLAASWNKRLLTQYPIEHSWWMSIKKQDFEIGISWK